MDDELEVRSWKRDAVGSVSGEIWWSGAPELLFSVVLAADGGLVELRVRAREGERVRARQMRDAPLGGFERIVRSAATSSRAHHGLRPYQPPRLDAVDDEGSVGRDDLDRERMRWRAWAADFVLRPRTGAGGRGDRPYAALAACYVAAFERGEPSPVREVAAELGFDETAVRNYLTKARERGLLTNAGPGRPGGQLTEKARLQLLGADHAERHPG